MEIMANHKKQTVLHTLLGLMLAGAILFYLWGVQLAGGRIGGFVQYILTFMVLLLPGLRVAELCLPDVQGVQKFAVTLPLALSLEFLSYLTFGRITPRAMVIPLLPLIIWQLWCFAKRYQKRGAPAGSLHGEAWILCAVFAGALVLNLVCGVFPFAKSSAAGNMTYHHDMLFSVGNAAAVQLGSPLPDIRVEGSHLAYHYLGDALPGFAAMLSGLPVWDAVCYYHFPVMLLFAVVGLYAAAKAYGASGTAAALLPAALFFLNGMHTTMPVNLYTNMNGVTTATALCAGILVLVFHSEDAAHGGKCLPLPFFAAYALAVLALMMSKNLYAILISLAALASVVFGLLFQKKFYRNGLLLGGIGMVMFGICWHFVYSHAINNLLRENWISVRNVFLDLFNGLPLGTILWSICLVLCLFRLRELPFSTLVVNAASIGGLLAYYLYHHYSASQVYFLLAAELFIWFCVLDLAPYLARIKPVQMATGLAAVLCLGMTLVSLAPNGRKGAQVMLRCLHLRPQYPYEEATLTSDDEAAALWLHDHMQEDEEFAVNRNAKDMTVGEGVWHYYTAMSGRQCMIESWRYSMDYGHDYHRLRYVLEQVSDVIFATPDAETAFALAREEGVRYLLVCKPFRSEPFEGAAPVFENEMTAIYDVAAYYGTAQ